MTKSRYDGDRFEKLALRLFELAGTMKALAQTTREEQLTQLELHDRKAQEWLGKLESWAKAARRKARDETLREIGARHARELLERERRRKERAARSTSRKRSK